MTAETARYEVPAEFRQAWWLLLLLGIVNIILGVLLVAWPDQTVLLLAVILGIWMIVAGLVRFFVGLFDSKADHRVALIVVGVIGFLLGLFVVKFPERLIWLIAILVGLFWLIGGMVELAQGIFDSSLPDRGWRILLGLLGIAAGAVVLLWPEITVLALAIIAGIYLIVAGIVEIVAAFRLRSA